MDHNNQNGLMPLNLQFFADEGGAQGTDQAAKEAAKTTEPATTANANPAMTEETQEGKPEKATKPQTLTALLETDKALQSQFDKLVAKALTTAQSKWEKEKDMSAEQLAEAKAQEKAQALAEREAAIGLRELRAKALDMLSGKELDSALVDCLDMAHGEEGLEAHLSKVEKAFRDAVGRGVKAQLAGSPPPVGAYPGTKSSPFQQKLEKYRRT